MAEGDGAAGGALVTGEFDIGFAAPADVEDMALRYVGAGGPTISRPRAGEGTAFANLGAGVGAAFKMAGEGEATAFAGLGEGEGSGFTNAVEDAGTTVPDSADNRLRFLGVDFATADFVGFAFAACGFK